MGQNLRTMNADDKWIVDSATGKILGVQTAGVATSDFVKSSTDPVTGGITLSAAGPIGDQRVADSYIDRATAPLILFVGDSTVLYGYATEAAPTSAFANSDGSVTLTYASSRNVQVGDRIGCTEGGGNTYNFRATESVVTATVLTNPYSYTFVPDKTPTFVGAHPTPSTLGLVYIDRLSAGGFPAETMALFGGGAQFVIAGNGGDDIDNILAHIDYLIDRFKPTDVVLSHGINDCYRTGKTVSYVIEKYSTLKQAVLNNSARLHIVSPPPQPIGRTGWTTTTRDWMISFRAAQAKWAYENHVDYIDWYSCAAGSTQAVMPTDTNAAPSSNVIGVDNIHPAQAGNYIVSKRLASKFRALFPTAKPPLPQSTLDGGILTNPLFSGTAGTRTNGTGTVAAGSVADTYDVTVTSGTATVTPYQTARSIAADGDACGNWQGATVAAVAAGDTVQIRTSALHSLVTNGKSYRITGRVKLKTNPSNCRELSLTLTSQTAATGNKTYTWRSVASQSQTPHPESSEWIIDIIVGVRGPQATHGSPTLFRPAIQAVAAAAGSFEFEVSQLTIKPI